MAQKQKVVLRRMLRELSAKGQAVLRCRAIGPYDGCHWEYCYFVVSRWRDTWDVRVVSLAGRMAQELTALCERSRGTTVPQTWLRAEISRQLEHDPGAIPGYTEFSVFRVGDKLAGSVSLNFYLPFIRELGNKFTWRCTECRTRVAGSPCHHVRYKGNGGVGVVHTDAMCDNCLTSGTCVGCDEYLGKARIHRGSGMCRQCLAKHIVRFSERSATSLPYEITPREGYQREVTAIRAFVARSAWQLETYCKARPEFEVKARERHASEMTKLAKDMEALLTLK